MLSIRYLSFQGVGERVWYSLQYDIVIQLSSGKLTLGSGGYGLVFLAIPKTLKMVHVLVALLLGTLHEES